MNSFIKFENVGKYEMDLLTNRKKELSNILFFKNKILDKKEFFLKDISFEIKKGKNLGICGEEKSGKSLILRMIEGKVLPDTGSVFIDNLQIGNATSGKSGLRFDLSVKENIFIKSMLHGIKKKEIENKLDYILDFAELDKYSLEKKLKLFSPLEQAQLIFSIVTAYDYDIFLFDEKIEVGKKKFISKCKERIQEMSMNTTIIIASKNKNKLDEYCNEIIYLKELETK